MSVEILIIDDNSDIRLILDELIKELGTPDDMIELEGTKYLSYKWGTTVTSIVFFVKDGIIYDARYDPEHKSTLTRSGDCA